MATGASRVQYGGGDRKVLGSVEIADNDLDTMNI